jgi:two-component system, NarL family, sensor histidine kinase DesK
MRGNPAESVKSELAARTALFVTLAVHVGYVGVSIFGMIDRGLEVRTLGTAIFVFTVLMSMHVLHVFHVLRLYSVRWPYTLAVQALLTYAPFVFFGWTWLGMPGFLAGSVLVLLKSPASWLLFSVLLVAQLVTLTLLSVPLSSVIYGTVSTALTGGVILAVVRLAQIARELHRARVELAQLAVADERNRITRDLHDVLGRTLSAIAIKGELVHRMVKDRDAAQQEIVDIVDLARQSLTDVRAVVGGYRRMTLEAEMSAIGPLLKAAEIDYTCKQSHGPLTPAVNELFAQVLHEAVTNVLRHSKAQECRVELVDVPGHVRLTVVNDGVPFEPRDFRCGGGLRGTEERVVAVGGRMEVDFRPGVAFTMVIELPSAA